MIRSVSPPRSRAFSRLVSRLRPHALPVAALMAVTFALYWPAIGFDFLNWDDGWYVTHNELIRSWAPANLFRVATEPSVKNYAPLTTLSLLIDHTLWGEDPAGYHFTNLLLHAINAVLVYVLLWRLSGSRMTALLTAALFAVHPVQVESVAWVSSRKGLLSSAFILASLISWLRPDRTARHEGYGLLFLLLALLAKALAVVLPAVVLTYDLWIRRKSFAESLSRQFLPGFAAVMFLLITISAQTTMYGGVRAHMSLGKLHILAIDSVILWQYAGSLVRPDSLCVLYDPPTEGIALPVALSVLGWAAVIAIAYRLRDRLPHLRWALLSTFVFLLPVLNLVPITTLMNDRYLYLPCVPLFALFAAGLSRLSGVRGQGSGVRSQGSGVRQKESADHTTHHSPLTTHHSPLTTHPLTTHPLLAACFAAASIVVVSAFAWWTADYLPVWRNGLTLWTYAKERLPEMPLVDYQLADAQYNAGRTDRAVALLETALARGNADEGDRKRFARTLHEWRKP